MYDEDEVMYDCHMCDHINYPETGKFYKNAWFCEEHIKVADRLAFNEEFGTD